MKLPFGRLMELVDLLPEADWNLPLGELAERWDEPVSRVADAIDACKVVRGETPYIPVAVHVLGAARIPTGRPRRVLWWRQP